MDHNVYYCISSRQIRKLPKTTKKAFNGHENQGQAFKGVPWIKFSEKFCKIPNKKHFQWRPSLARCRCRIIKKNIENY